MLFRKRCLVLLTAAVKSGETLAEHMAYLTDRVRVAENRSKSMGRSFTMRRAAGWSRIPIEDEAHLDSRRQAVGLPPRYCHTLIVRCISRP